MIFLDGFFEGLFDRHEYYYFGILLNGLVAKMRMRVDVDCKFCFNHDNQ